MERREATAPLFSDFTCQTTNKVASPRRVPFKPTRKPFWDKEFTKKAERESYRWQPAEAIETAFRHGAWLEDRRRVFTALRASGARSARLERFDGCGSDCVVEYSAELKRHRIRANLCGDRFCKPCCAARAHKVRLKLEAAVEGRKPLFITLSVKARAVTLAEQLNHLLRSFARMRRGKFWRQHVEAGAYTVEVKRGSRSGQWHPHVHVIALGSYLPQAVLSEQWRRATGDSFVVDVQRARDGPRAVGYICKYLTKGWSDEVLAVHDDLVECVIALRGRRLLGTFGEWRGMGFEVEPRVDGRWRQVGRLSSIVIAAHAGEEWALGVFRSLGKQNWLEEDRSSNRHVPDG